MKVQIFDLANFPSMSYLYRDTLVAKIFFQNFKRFRRYRVKLPRRPKWPKNRFFAKNQPILAQYPWFLGKYLSLAHILMTHTKTAHFFQNRLISAERRRSRRSLTKKKRRDFFFKILTLTPLYGPTLMILSIKTLVIML